MKRYILFFFLAVALSANAQMKEWGWQEIDSAYIICQYTQSSYSGLTEIQAYDDMRLEIGNKLSKFYSYLTLRFDSIKYSPNGAEAIKAWANEALKNTVGKSSKEQAKAIYNGPVRKSPCNIYKEYAKNKILTQDEYSKNYCKYEETMEPFDWEIGKDTAIILDYPCQKATCTWRGRNYTAWFTENIPISEGPYKFHGLPGLIMKITDEKNHYSWEIKGIVEVQNHPIYLNTPPCGSEAQYETIERKDFFKKKYTYEKRMLQALNNNLMKIGKSSHKSEKDLIGPIEMDFE